MYAQRPVGAHLLRRSLLYVVPVLTPAAACHGKFYLKHDDDKGGHVLVDNNFNITRDIDCEWAHTAAAAEAFKSPVRKRGHWSRRGHLCKDSEWKGPRSPAQFVLDGRVQHLFAFCYGFELSDWNDFLGVKGLREATGVDAVMTWEEWKGAALNRYK